MFPKLVVIDDPQPHDADLNMSLDEELLARLGDTAVLRCYQWVGRPISFGCFGKINTVRNDYPGRALVRRWTGGGIVEHGDDFTFTLLVPRTLPLASHKPSDSYRLIHEAVANALLQIGIKQVESAKVSDAGGISANDAPPHLQACFSHPVAFDLLVKGRKVVGGAQRRTKTGLLYQGSIQDASWLSTLGSISRETLKMALANSFSREIVHRLITNEEMTAATILATSKYASPSWMERY